MDIHGQMSSGWITQVGLQDAALGQVEEKTATRAVELRQILGQLGPSFVKVGQALSSRPDLLPQEYLEVTLPLPTEHPIL